jgi:hypothetical protein
MDEAGRVQMIGGGQGRKKEASPQPQFDPGSRRVDYGSNAKIGTQMKVQNFSIWVDHLVFFFSFRVLTLAQGLKTVYVPNRQSK